MCNAQSDLGQRAAGRHLCLSLFSFSLSFFLSLAFCPSSFHHAHQPHLTLPLSTATSPFLTLAALSDLFTTTPLSTLCFLSLPFPPTLLSVLLVSFPFCFFCSSSKRHPPPAKGTGPGPLDNPPSCPCVLFVTFTFRSSIFLFFFFRDRAAPFFLYFSLSLAPSLCTAHSQPDGSPSAPLPTATHLKNPRARVRPWHGVQRPALSPLSSSASRLDAVRADASCGRLPRSPPPTLFLDAQVPSPLPSSLVSSCRPLPRRRSGVLGRRRASVFSHFDALALPLLSFCVPTTCVCTRARVQSSHSALHDTPCSHLFAPQVPRASTSARDLCFFFQPPSWHSHRTARYLNEAITQTMASNDASHAGREETGDRQRRVARSG